MNKRIPGLNLALDKINKNQLLLKNIKPECNKQ